MKASRRAIPALSRAAVFFAIPLFCHLLFVQPMRAQCTQGQRRERLLEAQRELLQRRVAVNEGYLRRFAREEDFREHVVRERLGYADSGEIVYLFEE